jgi:uncharacterized membrane protein
VDPQGLSPPLAIQCQFHAGQPFTAVCQRCGTYMCAYCTEGGRFTQCAACRERTGTGGFPFDRNTYTFGGLFEVAWAQWKKSWLTLLLAILVTGGVPFLFSLMTTLLALPFADSPLTSGIIQGVMFVPQLVLQGWLTLGLLKISARVAMGEKPEFTELFSCWNRIGAWFVQILVLALVTTPPFLIIGGIVYGVSLASGTAAAITGVLLGIPLVIAMIYASLGLAFANFELVMQPQVGAIGALYNSWNMSRGKRLDVFLVGITAAALYMAGIIACFVGALFSVGLASTLFACLYLALRNGAPDMRT